MFCLLFQTFDKLIENAFTPDLGCNIQPYNMGYRLGYDRSRPYTRWTLWYSWDTAPVHRLARMYKERIRQKIKHWPLSCVLWRLSGSGLRYTDRQNKIVSARGWIRWNDQKVFCSDYDRRKQLMIIKSERSLRERELLDGPETSFTLFPKRYSIQFERPQRRGSLLPVPCSAYPSSALISMLIPPRKITKNKNSR